MPLITTSACCCCFKLLFNLTSWCKSNTLRKHNICSLLPEAMVNEWMNAWMSEWIHNLINRPGKAYEPSAQGSLTSRIILTASLIRPSLRAHMASLRFMYTSRLTSFPAVWNRQEVNVLLFFFNGVNEQCWRVALLLCPGHGGCEEVIMMVPTTFKCLFEEPLCLCDSGGLLFREKHIGCGTPAPTLITQGRHVFIHLYHIHFSHFDSRNIRHLLRLIFLSWFYKCNSDIHSSMFCFWLELSN